MRRSQITTRTFCFCLLALACWISGPVVMRPALIVILHNRPAGYELIQTKHSNKFDHFYALCKLFIPIDCEKSGSGGPDQLGGGHNPHSLDAIDSPRAGFLLNPRHQSFTSHTLSGFSPGIKPAINLRI